MALKRGPCTSAEKRRGSRVVAPKRGPYASAEERRGFRVADGRIWIEMLEKRRVAGSRVQRRGSRVFDKEHGLRVAACGV